MLRALAISSILLAVAACGGKATPATSTTTSEHAGGEHAAGGHEHDFPAEVAAFHDKLSPLWHADPGAARTDSTCTATGELDQLAEGVQNAAAPANVDSAAWSQKVTELREALTRLGEGCLGTDHTSFDADFTAVHDAFHHLIALLPQPEHHG